MTVEVEYDFFKTNNKMDEELQYLLNIKKLQDEVITLRTEIPSIYSKYFKRSQSIQLKRLLKVQINIPVTEIEIPDQANLPTSYQNTQPKIKTDDIEKECMDLAKVLDFI